jgi:hypothetical protein
VHRVLRPAGCFIVSTPDREVYSAPGMKPNRFHVREMSESEFVTLLRQRFRHVTILGQRPIIGSALLASGASPAPPLVFDRNAAAEFEACTGLPRAVYLVAVATNQTLPPLPVSLYIERSDLDTDALALADREVELAARDAELAKRAAALRDRAAELTSRTAELADRSAELAACTDALTALRAKAAAAEVEITVLTRELALTRSSLRVFLRTYLPLLRQHLLGR